MPKRYGHAIIIVTSPRYRLVFVLILRIITNLEWFNETEPCLVGDRFIVPSTKIHAHEVTSAEV